MMSKQPKAYHEIDGYHALSDTLQAISSMVLFSFAKNKCSSNDVIIRNFLARSVMTLKSIFVLWDVADYQDAWILHRALLDRLFHLQSLGEKDEFREFDDWSFFEQYKAQNRAKSDSDFKHEATGWIYDLTESQKRRINELSKNRPTWKRPKAEDMAKNMNMSFLYKYGYDYASMHVHPMANDGQQDFFSITKHKPAPRFPSQITVLANSVLVSAMILRETLNQSSFRWRKLLWVYIDQALSYLDNGDIAYEKTFVKLEQLFPDEKFCEPIQV